MLNIIFLKFIIFTFWIIDLSFRLLFFQLNDVILSIYFTGVSDDGGDSSSSNDFSETSFGRTSRGMYNLVFCSSLWAHIINFKILWVVNYPCPFSKRISCFPFWGSKYLAKLHILLPSSRFRLVETVCTLFYCLKHKMMKVNLNLSCRQLNRRWLQIRSR